MSTSNESSQNTQGSMSNSQKYEPRDSGSRKYKASDNVQFVPKNSDKKISEIETDQSLRNSQEFVRTPKTRNPRGGQFKTQIYSPKTNLLEDMQSESLRKSLGNAKEQIVYVQKNANASDLSENLSNSFVSDSQSSKSGNLSKNDSPRKPTGNPGEYQRRSHKSNTQLTPKYYNVYGDDNDSLQPRNSYDTNAKFVQRNSGGYAKPNKNLSFNQSRGGSYVSYKPKNATQEDESIDKSKEDESFDNNSYISPRNNFNGNSAIIYTPKNRNPENSSGLLLDNIDEPSDNYSNPMTSGRRSNKRTDQEIVYVKKTPTNANNEIKIEEKLLDNLVESKSETSSPLAHHENGKIEEQDSGKLMDELKQNSEIMTPTLDDKSHNGQEPIQEAIHKSEVKGENTKSESQTSSQASNFTTENKIALAETVASSLASSLKPETPLQEETYNQDTVVVQEQEINMELDGEENHEKTKRSGAPPKRNATTTQNESETQETIQKETVEDAATELHSKQQETVSGTHTSENHTSSNQGSETVHTSESTSKTTNSENVSSEIKPEKTVTVGESNTSTLAQVQGTTEFSRESQVEEIVVEDDQSQEVTKKSGKPKAHTPEHLEPTLGKNSTLNPTEEKAEKELANKTTQEKNEKKNTQEEVTPQPSETQQNTSAENAKKETVKQPENLKTEEEQFEKEKPRDSCFGGGKDGGLCQIF